MIKSETEKTRVAVVPASYEKMDDAVRSIVVQLELSLWLAGLKGKKVFIKPNLLGIFPHENYATTHPSLVASVVDVFINAGAYVTVGDNCGIGGYGLNQRVAIHAGMIEASRNTYKNVARETTLVTMKSGYVDVLAISKDMLEADVLVNLPKMKTHSLTIVTGAVKNMFGIVSGAGKTKSHAAASSADDFGKILADIFSIRPPDLNIMDAVVAMEGNGPSAGNTKKVGVLMASRNAVALDAVMCRVMGINARRINHIYEASALGLGPLSDDLIEIRGVLPKGRFKLPQTVSRFKLSSLVNKGFFGRLVQSTLALDESKCRKCKLCIEGCPAQAIRMGEYPMINQDICIKCLCCHELCPEGAWELKGLMRRMQRYGS